MLRIIIKYEPDTSYIVGAGYIRNLNRLPWLRPFAFAAISSRREKVSKEKIKGEIVHRSRDEFGEITIADCEGARSLYFGKTIQSTIRLDRPDMLVDDHSRAMMSVLLFRADPASVLLIGLGGCALVHFILNKLPGTTLHVVEIRKLVIDLAYEFFALPQADNVKIFNAPGQDFIKGEDSHKYDIILLDAFDETGPATALVELDFLSSCRDRMAGDGILAINLWNAPSDHFAGKYRKVRKAFDDKRLNYLACEKYSNVIVFGSERDPSAGDMPLLRKRALALKMKYGIDFPKYLKQISWNFG